jgi:uncharacterized membrane protein
MSMAVNTGPESAVPASSGSRATARSTMVTMAARARRFLPSATATAATVLVGLSAGFFYAYADSVTRGLARTDDATYVQTFQMINEEVRTPLFMLVFAGPALALALAAIVAWRQRLPAALMLLAFLLYTGGVVVVTMTGNVPLNERLASLTGLDVAALADARADFEAPWNTLNLIRTVAAVAALGCAAAGSALLRTPRGPQLPDACGGGRPVLGHR